jgi:predicted nucleotidyltransferase
MPRYDQSKPSYAWRNNMKVLCKVTAGSHLFGLSRPESDTDYKGVYMPEASDILMGTYKHTVNESTGEADSKNSADDIDSEFWSLKKFFDMIYIANNHALEILFAPEDMIIESSPEWEYIRAHKHELVCSQVSNYIDYCQGQAAKYGVKGSRVNAVAAAMSAIRAIPGMKEKDLRNTRAGSYWGVLKKFLSDIEYIEFFKADPENKQPVDYVSINNRKFQRSVTLEYMLTALEKVHDNYGSRAKQAANNEGIDWKAISHAYRVGKQAYELLETGNITLPMKEPERSYALALKQNTNNLTIPFDEVRPELEALADNLKEAVKRSSLPAKVDEEKWKEFTKMSYAMEIVEEWGDV